MQLTVGADPEVFLTSSDGIISGYGVIPGTKITPYKVEKGAVQVDGMALEFNIDPAETEEEFVYHINTVMGTLMGMIPHDTNITIKSHTYFDREYMRKQPEEAVVLGCAADMNAYSGTINPPPDQDGTLRTCAGHVHVGWTQVEDPTSMDHIASCIRFAKECDYTLGLPSVVLDEEGHTRRNLYGKAGSFRSKNYGCEYRVLSNFWLKNDELKSWVFKGVKRAVDNLIQGNSMYDMQGDVARVLIDSGDAVTAKEVCYGLGLLKEGR